MDKNRLEAFSDGVMAIIITIMVLGLKIPHNPTWKDYAENYPVFASYALSFVLVGQYWSNHLHLFHTATNVDNKVIWFNMFFLFWESLIPFTTASMGQNHFSDITVVVYALIIVCSTIAYIFLVNALCKLHGKNSNFSKQYKGHLKSYMTITVYVIAAFLAFVGFPRIAFLLMVLTNLYWFFPNHRINSIKHLT